MPSAEELVEPADCDHESVTTAKVPGGLEVSCARCGACAKAKYLIHLLVEHDDLYGGAG